MLQKVSSVSISYFILEFKWILAPWFEDYFDIFLSWLLLIVQIEAIGNCKPKGKVLICLFFLQLNEKIDATVQESKYVAGAGSWLA